MNTKSEKRKKKQSEKRITKSNNEKRKKKTNNEKWKMKNKKQKMKKEKQTNFTVLSNIELADSAWYILCTPQKWYVLESIVSITCAKWKYFLVNVLKMHSNVLRHKFVWLYNKFVWSFI